MSRPGTRVLGLVTIGQSPRDDLLTQMLPFLPGNLEIRQAGALDGLKEGQIAGLRPDPSDYALHTRLRNGCAVTIDRDRIASLVQSRIRQLEHEGADLILLLCTAEFPTVRSGIPLVEPGRLLINTIGGLRPRKLGIFLPLLSQKAQAAARWKAAAAETVCVVASPLGRLDTVLRAAAEIGEQSVDLVVMDCMGYAEAHRQLVGEALGKPVVLAISLVARILGELLGGT